MNIGACRRSLKGPQLQAIAIHHIESHPKVVRQRLLKRSHHIAEHAGGQRVHRYQFAYVAHHIFIYSVVVYHWMGVLPCAVR